jgi:hypothetical protein
LYFESCEEVNSSDHKPVRAAFTVETTLGTEGIFVKDGAFFEIVIKDLQVHYD